MFKVVLASEIRAGDCLSRMGKITGIVKTPEYVKFTSASGSTHKVKPSTRVEIFISTK